MKQVSKREGWEELVNNYTSSGEKQKSYCQQKGISYSSFKFWYYKLRDENKIKMATVDKSDFVNLKVAARSQEVADNVGGRSKGYEITGVKIILVNGIKLEIATDNILKLIVALRDVA